jgi:hypothetical protein
VTGTSPSRFFGLLAVAAACGAASPALGTPSAEELALLIIEGKEPGPSADFTDVAFVATSASPARLETRITTEGATQVQSVTTITRQSACRYLFETSELRGVLAGDKVSYLIDFAAIKGVRRTEDQGLTLAVLDASGPYCTLLNASSADYADQCAPDRPEPIGRLLARSAKIDKVESAMKTMKTDICP